LAGDLTARRAEDCAFIMPKTYHADFVRSITCQVIDFGPAGRHPDALAIKPSGEPT
jgi:hypothetical protein